MKTNNRALPPKVLVTGASGYVGSELCLKLLSFGVDVIATDRKISPKLEAVSGESLTWVKADHENSKDRKKIVQAVIDSR